MNRDCRYDILFEPVQIGPVIAKNRFYQVPHCTGMGTNFPHHAAKFREIKAEGGWAVVCTELCCIHPTSDVSPFSFEKLWCDEDEESLRLMVDAVHKHGALAGCELAHEGVAAGNRMTRSRALGPSPRPARSMPTQTRTMDLSDIREVRQWQRDAARRARNAGFDIVYVYASHGLGLPGHFLSKRINRRTDEYGGELANRARLLREMLEDTKDTVGDKCAVALRFGVDEVQGAEGYSWQDDGRRVVEMLAEVPDLWDVNLNNLDFDMMTSRFTEEGYQEPFTAFVKKVTSKPVVGVGRLTSPDTMVSMIKRGILDLIGAARPSIADPFLPRKIERGEIDDIRECIGCNVCLSMQNAGGPIRCTQNPTVGEEWRRGWHPERVEPSHSSDSILVVGGGPAGLEAARILGHRGYRVTLAEARDKLGGRVLAESGLPGLQKWRRVADYRIQQIRRMPNVEIYLGSTMSADDILESDHDQVVIATGSRWSREGIGKANLQPIPRKPGCDVFDPSDVMAGVPISGPVLIYDDENNYMGGVLAERLAVGGSPVILATPESEASTFLRLTGERDAVQTRLLKLGVQILPFNGDVPVGDHADEAVVLAHRQGAGIQPGHQLGGLFDGLVDVGDAYVARHRFAHLHGGLLFGCRAARRARRGAEKGEPPPPPFVPATGGLMGAHPNRVAMMAVVLSLTVMAYLNLLICGGVPSVVNSAVTAWAPIEASQRMKAFPL